MQSAYKLNLDSDKNTVSKLSVIPCLVLTIASWPTWSFLSKQVRWSGIPISLIIFQFVVIHTVKGFSTVNEAEVSLEIFSFLYEPMNVGNLNSGSSAFSKPSLDIWKLSANVLLKPSLKEFEHTFASMWNECNCTIVWTFFGIALLWDWNENGSHGL